MKILKHGKTKSKLKGTCNNCGCEIECEESETKSLIDRDTTVNGAIRYVKCPECHAYYLWVL
jgi:hypothetical protein